MEPVAADLAMFGSHPELPPIAWREVEERLERAETYWVATGAGRDPHPRPVWGVWVDGALLLSLGSPVLRRGVAEEPRVAVHLDSGTDVVVVDGSAAADGSAATVDAFLGAYDAKYDWSYDVGVYGPPTRVDPVQVLAWRAVGPAGRDGFGAAAKWTFG